MLNNAIQINCNYCKLNFTKQTIKTKTISNNIGFNFATSFFFKFTSGFYEMARKPSTSCSHAVDEKADDAEPQETAKEKYRKLKRRFKMLVFENEGYHEELRNLQRRLLKLTRDKNFIMERLLYFERPSDSSDDSDVTVEKPKKRKRSKNVDGDEEKKNAAKERKSLACSPTKPTRSVKVFRKLLRQRIVYRTLMRRLKRKTAYKYFGILEHDI
ncbi:INO80 complex subunit [Trichinella spiralis]|uniref:INO80 complex subunit n=1 Tax=Trichinella spiralis TaxID=6334 RepID=A0ABR3KXA9_TRISP